MTDNQRLFLDVHVIQTLPPANINRDDTGSPKTAQYGGVRRARVSSQAWKKAMRKYFYTHSEQSNVSVRTKDLTGFLAKHIENIFPDKKNSRELANKVIERLTLKKNGKEVKIFAFDKDKKDKLETLAFISNSQARDLVTLALNDEKASSTQLRETLKKHPGIDIALFGRMVASDPSLNEDASAQVAHAISTHKVENEFDFFTAMDDLQTTDQAGAGMLGSVEFNSATLYRYANVAVHQLLLQLDNQEMTVNALKLFIESFANSLPTGKVNTFANQTLPQFLMVNLRADRPVSLVSAFEEPAQAKGGYLIPSIAKLAEEFASSAKFTRQPLLSMYLTATPHQSLTDIGEEKSSLPALLNDFATQVATFIKQD